MNRRVVSFESVAGLIRAQMSLLGECSGCTCGPVKWRKPDGDGCNWILTRLEGADSLSCLDQLVPMLIDLRNNFNVPEPKRHLTRSDRARTIVSSSRGKPLRRPPQSFATDELLGSADDAVRRSRVLLRQCRAMQANTMRQCESARDAIRTSLEMLQRSL